MTAYSGMPLRWLEEQISSEAATPKYHQRDTFVTE